MPLCVVSWLSLGSKVIGRGEQRERGEDDTRLTGAEWTMYTVLVQQNPILFLVHTYSMSIRTSFSFSLSFLRMDRSPMAVVKGADVLVGD